MRLPAPASMAALNGGRYDHNLMIEKALATLREQLDALPLDQTLLQELFTIPELQGVYEAVHGKQFDRRNFQKRMLDLGLVERLDERRTGGPCRPAYLYRWVGETSGNTEPPPAQAAQP